jgi:acyl carrier protein
MEPIRATADKLASMPSREIVRLEVRRIIALRFPSAPQLEMSDDMTLGPSGLGFDSIALAEIALDCAASFSVPPPIQLLEASDLTIGAIIDSISGNAS